jgi:twitching motility protein PilJ
MAQTESRGFSKSGVRRRVVWTLGGFALLALLVMVVAAALHGYRQAGEQVEADLRAAAGLLEPVALPVVSPQISEPTPPPVATPAPTPAPRGGRASARSAAAPVEPAPSAPPQPTPEELLAELRRDVGRAHDLLGGASRSAQIQVFDAKGLVWAEAGLPPVPAGKVRTLANEPVYERVRDQSTHLTMAAPWSGAALRIVAGSLLGGGDAVPVELAAPILSRAGELLGGIRLELDARPALVAAVRGPLVYLLAAGAVLLLLALVVGMTRARGEYQPLEDIRACIDRVSAGDYRSRVALSTGDEIQEIGESLNTMLDRVVDLIETEADRDRLQKHIVGLLERVSQASEGNLTARAEVTADILGSVADAYNLMLDSIAGLIRQVRDAAAQVTRAVDHLNVASVEVNKGADTQAREITKIFSTIGEISESMKQALANAENTTAAANRATEVSVKGAQSVKNTIQGMNRIRANVQSTAKKIKSLGEKSIEINTIVEVIDELSTQTNMLALNAAIEASRAGEHGKGFVVVADEVRKLAERSIRATKDIEKLVAGIQVETNEAVTAMEESIQEVEAGSVLADQAGESLGEIEEVVNQAARLVSQISATMRDQVRSNQSVVAAMQQVYNVTKGTADRARMTAQTLQRLTELSRGLEMAIDRFRVEAQAAELAATEALAPPPAVMDTESLPPPVPPSEHELAEMIDLDRVEDFHIDLETEGASGRPAKRI